ncbi:hypothetical protein GCM10022237_07140 [Nocardioides ginsengisoli]|uniref:Calcium-binding protein n=1 Tax=Nocardioides ginsengisoli TaxID=363868 RepID=A0ABW3VV95_9ACTN
MTTRRILAALAALSALVAASPTPAADAVRLGAARPTCAGLKATIVGTRGNDVIRGTKRADVIVGLGGNDRIVGRGGDDVICGGGGNDKITVTGRSARVYGGAGDDRLTAEGAGSTLYGEAGHDVLTASAGGVALIGGDGDDEIHGADVPGRADGGPGDDLILLGRGHDTRVHGGPGSDRIFGGPGNDRLDGDDGIDECHGGPGTDTCHGGAPGGPANTPEDPDFCAPDAEVHISCQVPAVPERWKLSIEGTSNYTNGTNYRTEISWVATTYVEQYLEQDGRRWYLTAATGTSGRWTGTGQNGECAIDGSGDVTDGELSIGLALDELSGTYDLQWSGPTPRQAGTLTCPWGTSSYVLYNRAADTAKYLPWNPDDPAQPLSGSRTVQPDGPDGGTTVSYSWKLEPAADEPAR